MHLVTREDLWKLRVIQYPTKSQNYLIWTFSDLLLKKSIAAKRTPIIVTIPRLAGNSGTVGGGGAWKQVVVVTVEVVGAVTVVLATVVEVTPVVAVAVVVAVFVAVLICVVVAVTVCV